MPNTGCCPSFEERTRKIQILGKEVAVKNYICSADGVNYPAKPEQMKLGLHVVLTSHCPASCEFCIADHPFTPRHIDLHKFEIILHELKKQDLLFYVTFTGGEPFCEFSLLDEAVTMVFEIMGTDMEVTISTNGIGLHRMLELQHLPELATIHVSRHHYLDEINDKIFGMKMPTGDELREAFHLVPYRDLFVMNCMLQRDYIGSPEEVHHFLDFAIGTGVPKVSFITADPVNDFARAQRVPYEEVLRHGDPSLLFTRGFQDYHFCRCEDGVYVSGEGELIEFYGRSPNSSECSYCRGLTFGTDNVLRTGFHGEVIGFME